MKTIYPKVEIRQLTATKKFGPSSIPAKETHIEIFTFIRIKKGEEWYLVKVVSRHYIDDSINPSFKDTAKMMNRFHEEAYKTSVFYKVQPKIDTLDPDQREESERLKSKTHYHGN